MATRGEFAAFMEGLVRRLPRFAPSMTTPEDTRETLAAWYPYFEALNREELTRIGSMAVSRLNTFPSIRELLEFAGKAPRTDDDVGREVAERIWAAVERFGYTPGLNLEKVRQAIGEVAWEVVRLGGGWNSVCASASYDTKTTQLAQWRELAQSLQRKARSGEALDAPPKFDVLPQRVADQLKALTERIDVTPKPREGRDA